jgi:uroporphyrinogen decarboxylase
MPASATPGSAAGMQPRERLRAALAGARVDRVPVSAWGHFFAEETDPDRFVAATLAFQRRYDWDFLKVHSRASYHVEGWGFTYSPSNDPASGHICTGHPIASASDWRKLRPLGLASAALSEQLLILERLKKEAGPELPVIMTVFSPLDIAEKLIDRDAALMKRHVDEDPAALESALDAIARTFAPFVRELARLGADGIYFSTKWANNVKLSAAQYQRLVRPYDLAVLEPARTMWCNVLHLCEDHVQLAAMADYPVQVFHWDSHAGHNPSFSQGKAVVRAGLQKAMGGGVDPGTLAAGTPDDVEAKAVYAIREIGGRGFILGPGCSVRMASTPAENLFALRRAPALAALQMQH